MNHMCLVSQQTDLAGCVVEGVELQPVPPRRAHPRVKLVEVEDLGVVLDEDEIFVPGVLVQD